MLDRAVKQFICRLEVHSEIELLGVFCQTRRQTFVAKVQDLWRRRGALSLPILLSEAGHFLSRLLAHPLAEIELRKKMATVAARLHFVPDIHAPTVLEQVRALDADLGVLYGGPILKPAQFEIPRYVTLGIHHGKVQQYRGKKTTFWAVYNGEKTAGVTIQRINAGIDTGDVIEIGEIPIERKSLRRVSRELEALGFELYIQAIVAFKSGTVRLSPQERSVGKLYKDPTAIDILKLWWRQLARRFGFSKLATMAEE
jgi:methionyl-tRNA formyltransferase